MGEFFLNGFYAVLAGFGGTAAIFAGLKSVLKKWIEESIEHNMEKSMALFEQSLGRQDSAYNIKIQKEFAYYDKVQRQVVNITSTITESLFYLNDKDVKQFSSSTVNLKAKSKELSNCLDENIAYIDPDLANMIETITIKLGILSEINLNASKVSTSDEEKYIKDAQMVVELINGFVPKLREYIRKISGISKK